MAPTAYLDVDGHLVTKENGSVEPNALRGWVDEAREVTYAASRGRVADSRSARSLRSPLKVLMAPGPTSRYAT